MIDLNKFRITDCRAVCVERGFRIEDLNKDVNALLAQGYIPFGGIAVGGAASTHMAQVMVKVEEKY